MENTTLQGKLLKGIIDRKLMDIKIVMMQYEIVNATLSDKTLKSVAKSLDKVKTILENGFVNDSCKEIEKYLKNIN